MRVAFSEAVMTLAESVPELMFVTGDLGFNAFEQLSAQLGRRFLNAGVAEQTAVGVAAGLAHRGHQVIWYSIAPFAVYRPLEQIRLDVCLHNLPVFVVGNGGGYGYGIMGATHHALEDLACLSGLPNMHCHIPAFDDDVAPALEQMLERRGPAYLRLGAGPKRGQSVAPTSLQRLQSGVGLTAVGLGPLVHNLWEAARDRDVDVFASIKLPLDDSQELLWESLRRSGRLLVVEEHVQRGGLGEHLACELLRQGISPDAFVSLTAQGYPQGLQGSQSFHRVQSGLDVPALRKKIREMLP